MGKVSGWPLIPAHFGSVHFISPGPGGRKVPGHIPLAVPAGAMVLFDMVPAACPAPRPAAPRPPAAPSPLAAPAP